MIGVQTAYRATGAALESVVRDQVYRRGVPTTLAAADAISAELLPHLLDERRYLAAREHELIRAVHRDLDLAPAPFYPEPALRKMTYRAAGLNPKPALARVEVFDPETQDMQRKSVAPWVYPGEEEVLKEFTRRLAAGATRHAMSASRDVVIETARVNRVRWARVLGAEGCGWCAMLASRGAVYAEDTVRFPAHDHCDCTAVVARGEHWEGKETADRLGKLWKSAGGLSNFTKLIREGALDEVAT